MCGFVGFTGTVSDSESVINKMMDSIAHRGPDSSGTYSDDNLTLGFRRLSIIDLSEIGSQPIYNEDKSIVIVFNGEIYNYKKLKEELVEQGHVFYTQTDVEVIVHLYEQYGKDLLSRVRGMFAFVIYDKNKGEILAVRDFFGIKPFYYAPLENNILFGSEIKSFLHFPAFKKEMNETALENYLTFQYSVLSETFFKGVYKLPAAHYMIIKNNEISIERYWQPMFDEAELSLSETVTAIDKAVQDSVKKHMVSDVEVGSFLSSGVDSSYVAACFKGDKTFTVGFDYEQYNETEYAKSLSEKIKIDNYNKIISTEQYWDVLPKVQYHMDEPLADPAAVALYFVSELASQHVKVALSGEGADEFFGGYNIYREPLDIKILTDLPMPVRKFLGKLASAIPFSFKGKNFFIRGSKTIEERFIGGANIFSQKEREALLKNPAGKFPPAEITAPVYEQVKGKDDITKMQHLDIALWLVSDILLKADKMSMAHSLEVRVPFLDKEVFKIASKIPVNFRVNRTATKYAFRLAAGEYLPEDVSQKKKLGFPVPIRIWLREDKYYEKVKQAFLSDTAQKYFNTDRLVALLDRHKNEKADNSRKIWTVYMFLVWHEQFFET